MAEKLLRCAIYTRKSTEDGLEQEFNSLDAGYEACAAYALSQRHEGWVLVKDRYDDGGLSGGNMERPGLKRLLADIDAGTVEMGSHDFAAQYQQEPVPLEGGDEQGRLVRHLRRRAG